MTVGSMIKGHMEAAREGAIEGLRCEDCGRVQVTSAVVCPDCGGEKLATARFPVEGTVVTYTILDIPSEQFVDEAPYAFIIVQLDDGPRCTGWMPYVKRPEDIAIGDRVRFVKTYKPGMVFEKA